MTSFGKSAATSGMEPWGNPLPAGGRRVSEALPPTYASAEWQADSASEADLSRLRSINQLRPQFGNSLTLLVTHEKSLYREPFHGQREPAELVAGANAFRNWFTSPLLLNMALGTDRRNRRAWSVLREMIGTVHAPRNWADEHDLYLYGRTKG
ncbi:MAG TPA: hypothetical protein VF118_17525 [Gemmatimonadaceae bacterium]